jgi:alcohol dehydrogenase class IV
MSIYPITNIQSPQIIRIGGGAALGTGQILNQLGLYKALIVTDQVIVKLGHLGKLLKILDQSNISWSVFDETIPEPTDVCLSNGLDIFRSDNFDCVIGFGGGSSLDMAKAISAMSKNPGHVRNYKQPAQINRTGVPIILLPTTAGTGSELTKWCVITDTKLNVKYNLSGLAFLATAAIIDWTFTTTKPERLTADTAIDSLTHAIESFVSKKSSPFSDALALNAMPLIAKNIRIAFKDPYNNRARESLMLGASQAGMSFSNSSVALVHGMSRPIGAYFHIAHGLSNAILLAEVTNFSITAAEHKYAQCARVMEWASETDTNQEACQKLVEQLRSLQSDLKVPSPKEQGFNTELYFASLPEMARQALDSGSPQNNPRVPSSDEIIQIYNAIW